MVGYSGRRPKKGASNLIIEKEASVQDHKTQWIITEILRDRCLYRDIIPNKPSNNTSHP